MEQNQLTAEQKEFLIEQALQTEQGRIALASSMANPIRLTLDYQGIGRKLLVVDPLPQGALPVYDKDVKIPVIVIGKRGQAPDTIVEGERITVGTWEIVSYPQVRFSQVKERRYNLIDRAQQRAKLDLMAEEDRNIFNAVDRSSSLLNPTTLSGTSLSRDAMVAGLAEIGKWDCHRFHKNLAISVDTLTSNVEGNTEGRFAEMQKPVTTTVEGRKQDEAYTSVVTTKGIYFGNSFGRRSFSSKGFGECASTYDAFSETERLHILEVPNVKRDLSNRTQNNAGRAGISSVSTQYDTTSIPIRSLSQFSTWWKNSDNQKLFEQAYSIINCSLVYGRWWHSGLREEGQRWIKETSNYKNLYLFILNSGMRNYCPMVQSSMGNRNQTKSAKKEKWEGVSIYSYQHHEYTEVDRNNKTICDRQHEIQDRYDFNPTTFNAENWGNSVKIESELISNDERTVEISVPC